MHAPQPSNATNNKAYRPASGNVINVIISVSSHHDLAIPGTFNEIANKLFEQNEMENVNLDIEWPAREWFAATNHLAQLTHASQPTRAKTCRNAGVQTSAGEPSVPLLPVSERPPTPHATNPPRLSLAGASEAMDSAVTVLKRTREGSSSPRTTEDGTAKKKKPTKESAQLTSQKENPIDDVTHPPTEQESSCDGDKTLVNVTQENPPPATATEATAVAQDDEKECPPSEQAPDKQSACIRSWPSVSDCSRVSGLTDCLDEWQTSDPHKSRTDDEGKMPPPAPPTTPRQSRVAVRRSGSRASDRSSSASSVSSSASAPPKLSPKKNHKNDRPAQGKGAVPKARKPDQTTKTDATTVPAVAKTPLKTSLTRSASTRSTTQLTIDTPPRKIAQPPRLEQQVQLYALDQILRLTFTLYYDTKADRNVVAELRRDMPMEKLIHLLSRDKLVLNIQHDPDTPFSTPILMRMAYDQLIELKLWKAVSLKLAKNSSDLVPTEHFRQQHAEMKKLIESTYDYYPDSSEGMERLQKCLEATQHDQNEIDRFGPDAAYHLPL